VKNYFDVSFGPDEVEYQKRNNSAERYDAARQQGGPAGFGPGEAEFLTRRDSVYVASIGRNGWPYVQHRGGPGGFIMVTGPTTIAWAERTGNRQYITAGHLAVDDRVSVIAVDYPRRRRLKLLGHATYDADPSPTELERLGVEGRIDGLVTIDVVAFDWNCPKFITPRYTADEVRAITGPLQQRIERLEAQLATAGALPAG
jgi:uncharacterized protein